MKENARRRHRVMAADAFNLLLGRVRAAPDQHIREIQRVARPRVRPEPDGGHVRRRPVRAHGGGQGGGPQENPDAAVAPGQGCARIGRSSMEQRSREMLESTVQSLRNEGMLRKPVTVGPRQDAVSVLRQARLHARQDILKVHQRHQGLRGVRHRPVRRHEVQGPAGRPGGRKGRVSGRNRAQPAGKIWIATGSRCAACWSTGSFST